MSKFFDPLARRVVAWLERRRRFRALQHVRGRLLDIGCGPNLLVRTYQERGGAGLGIDVFNFGDADLVVPDSARLPFAAASFDTVSLIACLNHIPNRDQTLREACRVLKDDGRLLITMIPPRLSAFWHWLIRKHDEDQTERGMVDGEVWGLTTSHIVQLLDGAGFELESHSRFVFWLNNLYIARKRNAATARQRHAA